MNDVFLKRNHLVFINLCSKYWVCARLCSGTTGIRKTKPLLSQDSSCGERRQESSQRRHSCSRSRVRWRNRIWVEGMEGQAPSPRKWTRGGGKGVGCQVSFSTRPPFPGSVCTRPPSPAPILTLLCAPLPPQQQGSSGQCEHDLCVTSFWVAHGGAGRADGSGSTRYRHWQKWESPRNWLWWALCFVMSVNASYLI